MERGIQAAIRRLPKYAKEIEKVAMLSESIRSLCEDMADAESALQRLEKSDAPDATARCVEYRNLINELKAELLQALHDHPSRSGGLRGG